MIEEPYIDEDGNYIDDEVIDEYADIEFDDDDDIAPPKPKSKHEDLIVSICIILAILLILTAFVIYSF